MKVIFLIAGKGSRLNELTKKRHKSLIKIAGVPIIRRLVNQFRSLKIKSKNITFITGYKFMQIKREFGNNYNYFYYKDYFKTNNLHTLIAANNVLKNEDTILCFSDILISKQPLKKIINPNISNITILGDLSKVRNGTMKIKIDKKRLKSIGKLPRKESSGNYIGIMKIPKKNMELFKKTLINSQKKNKNVYFTEILNDLIELNEKINFIDIAPEYWMEIDNKIDLGKAFKTINKFNF